MVDVLVVGAGPAGLTTALLLAQRGVRVRCVDKHREISPLPRARGVHARAVEILRSCGVEPAMRAAELHIVPRLEVRTNLAEPPLNTMIAGGPELAEISPCEGIAIAQDVFESVLRDALLRTPGAELYRGTELLGCATRDEGVTAELLDHSTGRATRLDVQFVVAADGWASPVRTGLGIAVDGPADLGVNRAVTFRADLGKWLSDPPPSLVSLATVRGVLLRTHADHRWAVNVPDQAHLPNDAVELVRYALGLPTLGLEVMTSSCWSASAQVARRFGVGRVFLVGDAAHRVPPTGGTGISSAMADAHNLAWKLAAVIKGWAGPHLLDSYAEERRPVAVATTAACLGLWQAWSRGEQPSGVDLRMLDMGYAYGEPAAGLADLEGPCAPEARVGSRAPHIRLRRASHESILDLFGDTFALLAGPAGGIWRTAAMTLGTAGLLMTGRCGPRGDPRSARVPLAAHLIDEPAFATAYGLDARGAVLVRPDGHVAWRYDEPARPLDLGGATALLAEALLTAAGWDRK